MSKTDKYGRRLTVIGDGTPINPPMGEGRFQDALRRMRARIASSLELRAVDSTTPGDKYTHCSWGMCSLDANQWPTANEHIWPDDFDDRGRVARRNLPADARCPLSNPIKNHGCFYGCAVFTHKLKDREKAIALYSAYIAEREAKYGRKTTADDAEPWDTKQ
jgi:hypothetical protein